MSPTIMAAVALLYVAALVYLGFRAYKNTHSTTDYLLAGRNAHPFVMALSYGSTFISTSAIVGFGGVAAIFGMGMMWLTFLNIFVGIFIAFVVFGRRTRLMGHHVQAHTFPELLGRRFDSRFIQAFSGGVILIFMPLYASAVLIGCARYIETSLQIDFQLSLILLSVVMGLYVVVGGLKGVMYTDALQAVLMFGGMVILLAFTYGKLGGIIPSHQALTDLPKRIDQEYQQALPEVQKIAPAGMGEAETLGWLQARLDELKLVKTMDDSKKAEFMAAHPDAGKVGALVKQYPQVVNKVAVTGVAKAGFRGWTRFPTPGTNFFYVLFTSIIMGVGIGVLAQPQLAVRFMTVKSQREINRAVPVGGIFILAMIGVAYICGPLSNVWFMMKEHGGVISVVKAGGNPDVIIPLFINDALPAWFGPVFMLTLLSAAMSTLSSQLHVIGTSVGRDVYEKGILGVKEHPRAVLITRLGVFLAIIATFIISVVLPEGIIAAATAIFFGLCAAAFLPMYVGALFWKRMTKAGAVASLLAGFGVSFFWLMFIQNVKGKLPALLANSLLGVPTILPDPIFGIHWNWVEAIMVALPVSTAVAIIVSLLTKPESPDHVRWCFEGIRKGAPTRSR